MKTYFIVLSSLLINATFPAALTATTTVWQSDGSAANVQYVHNNLAHDGDTILLPSGTFVWASGVSLTKAITLQGQGIGSTIVRDGMQTGQFLLWDYRGTPNGTVRLTGIEFQDGGRTNRADSPAGLLKIIGSNINGTTFRMDNCKTVNLNGVQVFDTVIGVIDHCNMATNASSVIMLAFLDDYWNGDSLGRGDKSWLDPANFGGSQFLFLEDNTFTCTATSNPGLLTDSYGGGRFVFRYNNVTFTRVTTHGTESSGRYRGVRAYEVYRNTFTNPYPGQFFTNVMGMARSGVVLYHHNTFNGWNYRGNNLEIYNLNTFRAFVNFNLWSGADGTNPWDVNDPSVYFAGAAASTNVGLTVTVAGIPGWTSNQWAGYTIRRISNLGNLTGETFSTILSNTSNTITYTNNGGDPNWVPALAFTAADTFEIRRVIQVLDGPGRAGGSMITANPPAVPNGWNDQVTEPCYSWANTDDLGYHVNLAPGYGSAGLVRLGEHYFNDTSMPGYGEYTYPHPLISGDPPPTPTPAPTLTPIPTPSPTPTATASATSTPLASATPTPRRGKRRH